MKSFLLILVGVLFLSVANAQTDTPNPNVVGPKIIFDDAGNSFDFGEVEEGTYAKHVFTFKNTGDKPLVLKEVKPGCGCTVTDYTKEPVMPGESGNVTATFNSLGYGGRTFHKSMTVTTNMNENGVIVLFIKGSVKAKPVVPPAPTSPVRIDNK